MTKHYQTSRTPVFNIHKTTWRHLFIRHWRISNYDCQEVLQPVGRPSILSYKMRRTVIVTYKLTRSIEDRNNSHHKYHNTQVPQQHGKPLRGVCRKKQRKQNTNNERNAIVTCKYNHAAQTSLMHGWHSSEQEKGWKVGVGVVGGFAPYRWCWGGGARRRWGVSRHLLFILVFTIHARWHETSHRLAPSGRRTKGI